jgi:hypothetical protein
MNAGFFNQDDMDEGVQIFEGKKGAEEAGSKRKTKAERA